MENELDVKIEELNQRIHQQIILLESALTETNKDKNKAINQLKNRLLYLDWMHEKYKLWNSKSPTVVKQREVFYCKLGWNVGSEQNIKRPVVIVQNNIGNSIGKTTIVAPITTYDNSEFYINKARNSLCVKYLDSKGELIDRGLKFYEVPIEVELGSTHRISGIINVIHLREIDKKRLYKTPVAIITEDNFKKIIDAINYNFSSL